MMLLPLCGLLQIITVTMQQDITHFTGSLGVFTSPGYPNTPLGWSQWNITVNKDRRILLHFLDFELHESTLCLLDSFVLYDGAYESELELGKFCWSNYTDLNPSTYISSGNIFLLSLRTHGSFTRRGFKANYTSVSEEFKLTPASKVVTTKVTTTPTLKRASISGKVLDVTFLSTPTDVSSSTTSTIKLSTKASVTIALKNPATIPGIITAIVIALISVILSFAIAIWKCKICKRKDSAISDRSQISPSKPTSNIVTYEVVQQERGSMNPSYNDNQSEQQTNKALPQNSVIDEETSPRNGNNGTSVEFYEKPDVEVYSYADPREDQLYI